MTTPELTNDQVANYLRDHENFFETRPELLELLRLPDPRGGAVSLLERQAQVLRERNGELRNRLDNLLDIARDNDRLFEKTRQLVLGLLEAKDLNSLLSNLCHSLDKGFSPDTTSLLLYQQLDIPPHLSDRVQCLSADKLPAPLQTMLQSNRALCGVLRPVELEALFTQHHDRLKSAAMVPLFRQQPLGLLAIGSFNAEHFKSSLDTLFITHIGEVLSRRLNDFLPDPQRSNRAVGA